MRVLIVEDEKLLQQELVRQLEAFEGIEVVKCIQTVSEGISWLAEYASGIDLIFMDIELADGVCFEIFEAIDLATPIIFLTAYSEYAIQAFKVNSIDYLLKPINSKDLEYAIAQFNKGVQEGKYVDLSVLKSFYLPQEQRQKQRFLVQSGDTYKHLPLDEIAYFLSEDKYSAIVTFNNQRHILDESLNQLEAMLPPMRFYRPARNIIVNINAVVKASKYFNSRLKLQLSPAPDFDVVISRVKVKDFLSWMGNDN